MFKFIVFFLNSVVALFLLFLFGLSFVQPSIVPFVPSITLLTPVILVINVLFFLYWVLMLNKKTLLSLITLAICFPFVTSFFQLNFDQNNIVKPKNVIKIIDFNTLHFKGIDSKKSFKDNFIELVKEENPDILVLQETDLQTLKGKLKEFKYRKATVTNGREQGANPILSKYPIINKGSVGMDNIHIGRNALFVDIVKGADTIRCYNLHLTSYRLTKKAEELQEKGAKNLVGRLNTVFKHQEQQVEKISAHIKESPYPIIVCGDFNNMAFSYVYRELKKSGNLKDTFADKGKGCGATIDFNYFPTRIDFILVPENSTVYSHKVIKTTDWSDHYPVISAISL